MSMTPRERIMAVLKGEEPDKIPVVTRDTLRTGDQRGWIGRLTKRGMGVISSVFPYKPSFFFPAFMNPGKADIKFTVNNYKEKGLRKTRYTFETPVGTISTVARMNPQDFMIPATEEYFVKESKDWRIMNYIFQAELDNITPNYDEFNEAEKKLGEGGITYGKVEKTPFARAWVELATPERTLIDLQDKSDDILEYFDIQRRLHEKIAGIVAASPATVINILDNISDYVSPRYYREYCMPFYEIYKEALAGTDKVIACHMDGRLGHLKKDIAETPIKIIESFTVPPIGDISLTEARKIWPGRIFFINCPPHLNLAEPVEVRKGYEAVKEEWGRKKGLLIENSEDVPMGKVEMNLSAALDVFDY